MERYMISNLTELRPVVHVYLQILELVFGFHVAIQLDLSSGSPDKQLYISRHCGPHPVIPMDRSSSFPENMETLPASSLHRGIGKAVSQSNITANGFEEEHTKKHPRTSLVDVKLLKLSPKTSKKYRIMSHQGLPGRLTGKKQYEGPSYELRQGEAESDDHEQFLFTLKSNYCDGVNSTSATSSTRMNTSFWGSRASCSTIPKSAQIMNRANGSIDWEIPHSTNRLSAVGANNKKCTTSAQSSSPPASQLSCQHQKTSRSRRTNLGPSISSNHEVHAEKLGHEETGKQLRTARAGLGKTESSINADDELRMDAYESTHELKEELECNGYMPSIDLVETVGIDDRIDHWWIDTIRR
ncbi:hypothetical protein SAY87_025848 [Trapa incisa]|uniref:Uncharacterized protein n=1 Tax=Trapa incisa TaxID=236973 RepID=A0AAN7JCL8_9MYRT|nr:hypothetical protein SAY87_025848 [Trapa incisa]